MKTMVVQPAQALSDWIASSLERWREALFTVAYIDEAGAEALREGLEVSLARKTAKVRILFQDLGFRTHPEAIRALQKVAKGQPGTLKLHFAGPELKRFHAKAYGFRKGGPGVEVLLGSSNSTGKALGTECGELNVRLVGSVAAEAWGAMEQYWNTSHAVTGPWLERYAKAHAKYQREAAKADALARRWKGAKRRKVKTADLWRHGVTVAHTEPMGAAESDLVEKRIKAARRGGVEIPTGYVTYDSVAPAKALASKTLLKVHWRARGKDESGLSYLTFVRSGQVVRVGNERLGRSWVLPVPRIRGTTVTLKRSHLEEARKLLARRGYEYRDLARLSGRLRARAKDMRSIYRALQKLAGGRGKGGAAGDED